MTRLERPLLVLSDLHLSREPLPDVDRAVARTLREHTGHELVLNGDVFDLSHDPPWVDPAKSVLGLLGGFPETRAALRTHLAQGAPVTLVAGNHDAPTMSSCVRVALAGALELQGAAPLRSAPWCVRRGAVHIEHGHLYDADNAPTHPLSLWSPETEPLGIALTRRFVAPSGVSDFAHAHETTPLQGLLRAFALYGVRTPAMIARYFATAFRLCWEAGRQPLAAERELGDRALAAVARELGVQSEVLEGLLDRAPAPTHHDFLRLFMRLYFDRVAAALLAVGAGAAAVVLESPPLAAGAAIGLAYLVGSAGIRLNGYRGRMESRLREAAHDIRELTGARWVLFGHTHREDRSDGYYNSGSFAYGRARPFIVVSEDGVPEPRAAALV